MPDIASAAPEKTGPAPVTDRESGLARIQAMLDSQTAGAPKRQDAEPKRTPEDNEQPEQDPPPAGTQARDSAAETGSETGTKGEADATEPAAEKLELPETLDELAEALGWSADDLAAHVKAKVGEKGEMVSLADIRRGHMRDADYTQKSQRLADERRSFDTAVEQATRAWQAKLQTADELLTILKSEVDTGPSDADLARLANEDPAEYVRSRADKDRKERALAALRAHWQNIRSQEQQATQQRLMAHRAEQQDALRRTMPELADPEKASRFESDSRKYLVASGFSDLEIDGLFNGPFDHRQILVIRDAMRFRAMKEGKTKLEKTLRAKPPVLKPGAASGGRKPPEETRAALVNRLRTRAGGREAQKGNALALISHILDRSPKT